VGESWNSEPIDGRADGLGCLLDEVDILGVAGSRSQVELVKSGPSAESESAGELVVGEDLDEGPADDEILLDRASPCAVRSRLEGVELMKPAKKEHLEKKGWKVGSAEDFLGLTSEEAAVVEVRLRLADAVKLLRRDRHLTQTQLAKLLGSSQSRVAKVEAAADSVSLDLLIRSFLAMGATTEDLARVIGGAKRIHAR
jgi:predicted XRE-type DNA-binding protein